MKKLIEYLLKTAVGKELLKALVIRVLKTAKHFVLMHAERKGVKSGSLSYAVLMKSFDRYIGVVEEHGVDIFSLSTGEGSAIPNEGAENSA